MAEPDQDSHPPPAMEPAGPLEGRSALYGLLGWGLSFPEGETAEVLRTLSGAEVRGRGERALKARDALGELRGTNEEELRRQHLRLFDPAHGPFPYEAEYRPKLDEFARAQLLADLMGFYRAFGVEPENERPDHLVAELQFVHLLLVKEQHALGRGEERHAELCRGASTKFLREHLLQWGDEFLKELDEVPSRRLAPFYERMVELLRAHLRREKETLA